MVRARRRKKSSEIEVSLLRALSADVAVSESSVARESENNQTKAFCPVFFLVQCYREYEPSFEKIVLARKTPTLVRLSGTAPSTTDALRAHPAQEENFSDDRIIVKITLLVVVHIFLANQQLSSFFLLHPDFEENFTEEKIRRIRCFCYGILNILEITANDGNRCLRKKKLKW